MAGGLPCLCVDLPEVKDPMYLHANDADCTLPVVKESKADKCARCSNKTTSNVRLGNAGDAMCIMCEPCAMAVRVSLLQKARQRLIENKDKKRAAPNLYTPTKKKPSA